MSASQALFCQDCATIKSRPLGTYSVDFEEDDVQRSDFVRKLTLNQIEHSSEYRIGEQPASAQIPRTLIRYWHDPQDVPCDVQECLDSWEPLREEGFEFRMFDDVSAAKYIASVYGPRESAAFSRCRHPAMRSDYLRMCFVLAEGGLYVDSDDVLLSDEWRGIFRDGRLKLQPLCYDIPSNSMVSATAIWQLELPTEGRIFYVNNDPIAAPANHPILRRALASATEKLLAEDKFPEIQSTTGPGNLTVALAVHARELTVLGVTFDFELLSNWVEIAEIRWQLSYRNDARNWRNM